MEMLVTRDWLRRKIESDLEMETDAGAPVAVLESVGMFLPGDLHDETSNVVQLKHAFGVFIRQLRRRDQLTLDELARRARVDTEDLRQIECDPHFQPRPRVVHQLAEVFDVPLRPLMKLSGATIIRDERFEEEAYRFAAKSDDLSKLNRDEQRALNEYVKFLISEAATQ